MAVTADEVVHRLETELWPVADVTADGRMAAGFVRHGALHAGGVTMVLPLADRRAAAEAMVRWTDATTIGEALARVSARMGMLFGAGRLVPMQRIQIRARGGGGACPTLHEYLGAALDVPEVALSCNLGSARPNQKPIVRVHGRAGETIAFAKVGWNDLTRSLVETEASFLESPRALSQTRLRLPRVLHTGWWNERFIVVTSPLVGSPRLRSAVAPTAALVEVVAAFDDVDRTSVADSAYLRSLDRRIDSLDDPARTRAQVALHSILGEWGAEVMRFGQWHGDWTPWNMSSSGPVPIVWDWERTAPATPVGFDPLHWAFHTRLGGHGTAPRALVDAAAAAGPTFRDLGVSETAASALSCLYALEMHIRFSTSADAGTGAGWVVGLLDAAIGARTR